MNRKKKNPHLELLLANDQKLQNIFRILGESLIDSADDPKVKKGLQQSIDDYCGEKK